MREAKYKWKTCKGARYIKALPCKEKCAKGTGNVRNGELLVNRKL